MKKKKINGISEWENMIRDKFYSNIYICVYLS